MPFKVTVFRLEAIADLLFVLGLIAGLLVLVTGEFFAGILILSAAFLTAYVLYAIAKILQNTENILEALKNTNLPDNPIEEETDHEEH